MRGLLLSLFALACMPRPPLVRLGAPTSMAVAFAIDGSTAARVEAPPGLSERIYATLGERNLKPAPAGAELSATFHELRDTSRRLGALCEHSDAPLVLLIETRASFFSQLQGRYRWTVGVRLSVAEKARPSDALTASFDLPAMLDFDHEREEAAVAAVAPIVADRVAVLLDRFLAGRLDALHTTTNSDAIYFVLIDRFADGDASNNAGTDRADPSAWHGGDLKGVLQHLDELHELGIRTLWLSPFFKSRQPPFFGHGAFHGYWVEDLQQVEPRFGSAEDLSELSGALHQRGMRLVIDMVLNHVAYDAALTRQHPEWFHHNGPITDWNDAVQLVTSEVHGLPDLAEEQPEVARYLIEASKLWINRLHPDGLRLDAVRHVPLEFWATYNAAMKELAGPDFMLLGELLDGSPSTLARTLSKGGFTHLFDFPTYYAIRDVACDGKPLGRLAATMSADRIYADANRLVTFLDNHDLPRITSACHDNLEAVSEALTIQLTLRGTPAFTYGIEKGLTGDAEPANRGDMHFDVQPGTQHLAQLLAKLLRVRREHAALRSGSTRIVALQGDLLAFVRSVADDRVLVVVNHASHSVQFDTAALGIAAVDIRDALSGQSLEPNRLPVAPHRALVATFTSRANDRPTETRPVRISVTGTPPMQATAQLYLVGLGPELGDWAVSQHARPLRREHDSFVADLTLPAQQVYEMKLVFNHGGANDWEPGENRYLFVPEGASPLAVEWRWGSAQAT